MEGMELMVKNRANTYAIGLYSDYNETGYQTTVGFEVSAPEWKHLAE